MIDLLATDKSQYFAQHLPIILLLNISVLNEKWVGKRGRVHKLHVYTQFFAGVISFLDST